MMDLAEYAVTVGWGTLVVFTLVHIINDMQKKKGGDEIK